MKKKILGVLLTLVLAVTGFGLVGCGGGSNPAPGPGPGPVVPEVSYDDDTTPVPIDETGLLFDLWTTEEMEEDGWENISDYNQACVYAVTEEVVDLVIPAYVTDGENTYRVTWVSNLLFTIDNIDDYRDTGVFTGVNEFALGVKTITIPSTVEEIYSEAFVGSYTDDETNEDVLCFMENLEQIIFNNRTTQISGLIDVVFNLFENPNFPYYQNLVDKIFADKLNMSVEELYETVYNEEPTEALLEMYEQSRTEAFEPFFTCDNDLYYLGNPGNPYMMLVRAGETYFPGEELDEGEELIAVINDNCKIILDYAFDGNVITGVVLPSGLVEVGDHAFWGSNISEIIIPDTVERIGQNSFNGCENADTLYLSSQITDINLMFYFSGCGFDIVYINNADFGTYLGTILNDGATVYVLKEIFDNNEDILTANNGFARLEVDGYEEYNGNTYVAFSYYEPPML